MLETGTVVSTMAGRRLTVGRLLGEGTQGSVYEASDDRGSYAIKWYRPGFETNEQRKLLTTLVRWGAPDHRYLWPTDLVTSPDDAGFGYSMPIRPHGFVPFSAWMTREVDLDFRVIATIGFHLADAFLRLHAVGLCYRDLNFGNVFFDPHTGDVLICDTDNIGIEGRTQASVRGTTYCMAPELIRGDAEPSTATDRYSLAVMLFFLLMLQHPLDGAGAPAAWDADAMADVFGRRPVFVLDPDDDSNRPVQGDHDHVEALWGVMPSAVKRLFIRAFTAGLVDPMGGRVLETEWRAALVAMRDLVVTCDSCRKLNLLDEPPRPVACWSCGVQIREPLRLSVGRSVVAADSGAMLHAHHLLLDYDFAREVACVAEHPELVGLYGLQNRTSRLWSVTMPDGSVVAVEPSRSIRLTAGMRVALSIDDAAPVEVVVR